MKGSVKHNAIVRQTILDMAIKGVSDGEISEVLKASPSLIQKVRRANGIYHKEVQIHEIVECCALLINTQMQQKEIAEKLGYSGPWVCEISKILTRCGVLFPLRTKGGRKKGDKV